MAGVLDSFAEAATKVLPKEMLPLVDRPLIQRAVEEAREAGIEEFIFVSGRGKTLVTEHFEYQPELIIALKEKNKTQLLEKVRASNLESGFFSSILQQNKAFPQPPNFINRSDQVIHKRWLHG